MRAGAKNLENYSTEPYKCPRLAVGRANAIFGSVVRLLVLLLLEHSRSWCFKSSNIFLSEYGQQGWLASYYTDS